MVGYLQLVGAQKLLCGGGALDVDRRAAGDDNGGAGQHLCGNQAHAVTHGSQVRGVAQARVRAQTLAHWKRRLGQGMDRHD